MPVGVGARAELLAVAGERAHQEQAGATCQFLYHGDDGKHREKLLDFVVAYYNGDAPRLNVLTAFGMSGKELGGRVVQFARAVSKGWRPNE